MTVNIFTIQFILMAINAVASVLILGYAIYLYYREKKVQEKYAKFDDRATKIIDDANRKALEIITKSDYVSSSLKGEIDENFDALLEKLKTENTKFYEDLEHTYENSSKEFMHKMEVEGEQELDAFAKEVSSEASKVKDGFEKIVQDDYQRAHKDIKKFKEEKKAEYVARLEAKLKEVTKVLLPAYISKEDQVKLVNEALEKASKEANHG